MGQRYSELVRARELGIAFVGPDNRVIEPGQYTRSFSPSVTSCKVITDRNKSKPGPKANNYSRNGFPCTKCSRTYTRLYVTVNHLIQGLLHACTYSLSLFLKADRYLIFYTSKHLLFFCSSSWSLSGCSSGRTGENQEVSQRKKIS